MIRILLVVMAYLLVMSCDNAPDIESYYKSVSNAYAAIAAMSACVAILQRSKLIFAYFAVNILCAYLSVIMVSDLAYSALSGLMWYWTINLSLIVQAMEVVIIVTGGASVWNYLYTRRDNGNCVPWLFGLGKE